MIRAFLAGCVFATILLAVSAEAADAPKVFFKNLKNGDVVTSPVRIEFGLQGMTVANAGSMGAAEGHHHLLIDRGYVEKGQPIPADTAHIHFGQGQTEGTVELPPGKHTLTLQFADGLHGSYGKELSATVEIEVKKAP